MTAIDKIEALALQVAEQAQGPATLDQRIAALKALSPYYALLNKARISTEDDENSMEHLVERIHEAEHDGQRIQAGTGRGSRAIDG